MSAGRLQRIKLDDIRIDGGTQVRTVIDETVVADYASRVDDLPAVIVYDDGSTLWLADGFHRWHAHRQSGRDTITARAHQGGRNDAVWHALSANRAHGLRLNNADKRCAIQKALRLRPDISNRQIADHVGVSHVTVASVRDGMESTGQIDQLKSRAGADGKSRKVPTPPPVADPPPTIPTSEIPKLNQPVGPDDGPPPAAVEDRLGHPVTDERIAEAFRRDHELVELCTALSKIKSQIKKAIDGRDPLYADLYPKSIIADLTNARRQIDAARPYSICPYCGGDGCQACYRRGWVNALSYKARGQGGGEASS